MTAKDSSIEIRVHAGTKARWRGKAQALGYHPTRGLSLFIEDTIEEAHFGPINTFITDNVMPILTEASDPCSDSADPLRAVERVGDSTDEPESEVAPGVGEPSSPRGAEPSVAVPAHPGGGEPVAPDAPLRAVFNSKTCPLRGQHRKGWKCKGCGEMP